MRHAIQIALAALALTGCADPLLHREGGDFLGLRSAWKRIQIRRIEQDWGVHKPKKVFIYQP